MRSPARAELLTGGRTCWGPLAEGSRAEASPLPFCGAPASICSGSIRSSGRSGGVLSSKRSIICCICPCIACSDTAWFSILDNEWPALKTAYEKWLAPENFDRDGRQRMSLSDMIAAAR